MVMRHQLELPAVYEKIAAMEAQKNGKSLEEYLPELIVSALVQQSPSIRLGADDRAARIQRFRRWAESNTHDSPHLTDEEINRDALYPIG